MSKTRQRLLALALAGGLLMAGTPAWAATCTEATITWDEGGPTWHPTTDGEGIYTAIVGHYLNVYLGTEPPANNEITTGVVSVELVLSDVSATVCPDGVVTLESAPQPEIGSGLRSENLAEIYPDLVKPVVSGSMPFQPW